MLHLWNPGRRENGAGSRGSSKGSGSYTSGSVRADAAWFWPSSWLVTRNAKAWSEQDEEASQVPQLKFHSIYRFIKSMFSKWGNDVYLWSLSSDEVPYLSISSCALMIFSGFPRSRPRLPHLRQDDEDLRHPQNSSYHQYSVSTCFSLLAFFLWFFMVYFVEKMYSRRKWHSPIRKLHRWMG